MSQLFETSPERVAVLLPLPLSGAFDYLAPEGLQLEEGDFVEVPFGKRTLSGVVWRLGGEGTMETAKLKTVLRKHEAAPLSVEARRFIEWIARYTVTPPGPVLKMSMSVPAALDPPAPKTAYIKGEPPEGLRITPARQRVLALAEEGPPRLGAELAREAGVTASVVKGLYEAGALKAVSMAVDSPMPAPDPEAAGPDLSAEQETAAATLQDQVQKGEFVATLLDGVPGSGKTEVYFEAVAEALRRGKQVLVLLPEIALSAQWYGRFAARFGAEPVEWHSDLSNSQRRANWRAVAEGRAKVVVGARSALMLPYPDLGLIVVDEEHDAAFKQEDGVIYNARDMAVVRASLGAFPVILASATPSLETVANAETGRYRRCHLPERHAGALLPEVTAIDLRSDPPPRGNWLAPPLRDAIAQTLAAGEQTLLYLNRRGYAPLTLCRKCGFRLQCPRCTAWLVEHRGQGRLQCHHCGYNVRTPEACPECESEGTLTPCGPGVERLAEEVAELYPDARVLVAASDTITGPVAAAEMVRSIEDHEVDLVIGTQMVAKGYHFPMLTLVGVVDADLGLEGGDLRAAERTYQLLYQVAGRAGREGRPGRVVLQTYMPDHPVMAAMVSGDRDRFLETESAARRDSGMPPFGRLVALVVSGPKDHEVEEACRALSRTRPDGVEGVLVLGPAPAPLAILRGRHRKRFLIKARRETNIQALVQHWVEGTQIPNSVRVQIDVDPYSFM